ncbi:hypothetical protein SAMN04489743_0781 [Pseudarthrobacter equi]|uniref:Uncharacterized protein n=1 Tax=Pseudarthrobacter equi TaxID=728066 RepID=A0A1H1UUB1_9MICC|nr:hypothetical protein [Pseudarthrobacter equi]SDS75676.1 hypothetical protein SAMN04489743_0781 [Pseudarthrobacter equi]
MTSATEHRLAASGERTEPAGSTAQPLDLGLLVTLNSRMHCRTPMQRLDPLDLPVGQPVYVDESGVLPADPASPAETVVTYRCACGFTLDDPAFSATVSDQALAS